MTIGKMLVTLILYPVYGFLIWQAVCVLISIGTGGKLFEFTDHILYPTEPKPYPGLDFWLISSGVSLLMGWFAGIFAIARQNIKS